MAFKPKRSAFKRRKHLYKRRNRRMMKPGIPVYSRVHAFKRTVASKSFLNVDLDYIPGDNMNLNNQGMTTLSLQATQSTHYFSFGQMFSINELPNFTEFTQLYDAYKIVGIKYRIIPVNNTTGTQNIANAQNGDLGGFLHWVIDYDDNDAPTASDVGIDELRQRNDYKVHNLFNSYNKNGFVRYIKPRIPINAESGALVGTIQSKPRWLDCNSIVVPHYGIKGVFEIVNPSAEVRYVNMKIEATYYLRFKDPR